MEEELIPKKNPTESLEDELVNILKKRKIK